MEQSATKALLTPPPSPVPAAPQMIVDVARAHGVSPFRQMREMWAVRRGPGKLKSHEYHASGVFDPEMSIETKKTFVGLIGSFELNKRLSPKHMTYKRAFVRDKVMYSALLQSLGVPTTHTQAVVHGFRHFGNLPTLRDPQSVVSFLKNDAVYPLFGKPCDGSQSVGSALITGCNGDMLTLGNGREVDLNGFAHEVSEDYPDGYILQSAIQQHPDMSAITGTAVGTLRVVTVRDHNGADVLYAVWKLPSPSAMSDNFWQAGSMVGHVGSDGIVQRCKRGTGLAAEWIDTHPKSGAAIVGAQIPFWDEVKRMTRNAHMLFPEFGVFGWDIAIDENGPLVVECNANPFHTLYQLATGRGMLNAEHMARVEKVVAHTKQMRQDRTDIFLSRKKQRQQAT